MNAYSQFQLVLCLLVGGMFVDCHAAPAPPIAEPPRQVVPLPPPTLAGTVVYDDGSPASGATVAVTNLGTGSQAGVVATDRDGSFRLVLPASDYALAVASDRSFAFLDKQVAPDLNVRITMLRSCRFLAGHASRHGTATLVNFARRSNLAGDNFMSSVHSDGSFAVCLPEASYSVFLSGDVYSLPIDIDLPATTNLQIQGFAADDIRRTPLANIKLSADRANLLADIAASNPTIVGLGEATHGTAEFASVRGDFTLELIRNVDVRLILFEVDAISATALDDYVNGLDVDIAKAVAALGFWVTDTYEFLRFLELVRDHNSATSDKVHIWGIDLQDTALPVGVLLGAAATLSIGVDDQATLRVAAVKRGKDVAGLPAAQRTSLDALLSRLNTPRSRSRQDLLVAVAARSLAMQLAYWDGDAQGHYRSRRDSGMASLTTFLVSQLAVKRACLWAHAGHISKEGDRHPLGQHLASNPPLPYYGIGFYLYQGSARAWDRAAKIGVISHPIPAAPPYTMEGAVMRAAGLPDIAWLPLRTLPAEFRAWLATPRFVREVGAAYVDVENTMMLRPMREAFDAVVVIKVGHDSTPTPTGVRKVAHE